MPKSATVANTTVNTPALTTITRNQVSFSIPPAYRESMTVRTRKGGRSAGVCYGGVSRN
jgi:hypothetical protein